MLNYLPKTLAVLGATICITSTVRFWHWLQDDDSPAATIRNLVLVVASILAFWIANRRIAIADNQLAVQRGSLLHDRYQRAADMLGSPTLSVRLGGIYALEQLSMTKPDDYHIQVMKLLTAFVRHPPHKETYQGEILPVDEGVREVVRYLRSREQHLVEVEDRSYYSVDLSSAYLERKGSQGPTPVMFVGAHLIGANLSDAQLQFADFSRAKLARASFIGAKSSRARFNGADLRDATFEDADLSGAEFQAATLVDTNFRGCKGLTQAQLDSARRTKEPPCLLGVGDANTGKPLVWKEPGPGPQVTVTLTTHRPGPS